MNQRDSVADVAVDSHVAERGVEAQAVPARQRYVGRPMERLEDPAILTGRGRYGDDIAVKPGTLQAAEDALHLCVVDQGHPFIDLVASGERIR